MDIMGAAPSIHKIIGRNVSLSLMFGFVPTSMIDWSKCRLEEIELLKYKNIKQINAKEAEKSEIKD